MNRVARICSFAVAIAALFASTPQTRADVDLYYDVTTGEVVIDTADTWTGEIFAYVLNIDPAKTSVRFLGDNHTPFMFTPLIESGPIQLGEVTPAPVGGLYSVGKILPAELSESEFNNIWQQNPPPPQSPSDNYYIATDQLGARPRGPIDMAYGPAPGIPINDPDLPDIHTLDWADAAVLLYNPSDGEVGIDTTGPNGGYISSYLLKGDDVFNPSGHESLFNSLFVQADEDTIGEAGRPLPADVYSLGNIVDPGLTLEEFSQLFTQTQFMGKAGIGSTEFDYDTHGVTFAMVLVPEPATLTVIVLTAAAPVRRRRRWR